MIIKRKIFHVSVNAVRTYDINSFYNKTSVTYGYRYI